jgi:hypothetical protein
LLGRLGVPALVSIVGAVETSKPTRKRDSVFPFSGAGGRVRVSSRVPSRLFRIHRVQCRGAPNPPADDFYSVGVPYLVERSGHCDLLRRPHTGDSSLFSFSFFTKRRRKEKEQQPPLDCQQSYDREKKNNLLRGFDFCWAHARILFSLPINHKIPRSVFF